MRGLRVAFFAAGLRVVERVDFLVFLLVLFRFVVIQLSMSVA